MISEKDKQWIKNWKPKGVKMRKTKTKPAKNPILGKLLKLKYRINDVANSENGWSDDIKYDKKYIMSLISDVRKHNFKTLAPEDGHCCNRLWRKYA